MRITILGRAWNMVDVDALPPGQGGDCDDPATRGKTIRILRTLPDRERLRVELHEMLHAAAWDLFSEEWVDRLSSDMAAVLWRRGWRPSS